MAVAPKWITTIRDQAGKRSRFEVNPVADKTLSEYGEAAIVFAEDVNGVITGVLETIRMFQGIDISGLANNTVQGNSDVEESGQFIFSDADGRHIEINVPGIISDYFVAGSNDLDTADPTVDAFVDLMIDGVSVTGGTAIPCNIAEIDVVSLVSARKVMRPSGKA